ncbi:MAG: diguanylate cyclase [Caldisericota bacterium]|nr:diguanylate cyclase [Caldisericota bacterium]
MERNVNFLNAFRKSKKQLSEEWTRIEVWKRVQKSIAVLKIFFEVHGLAILMGVTSTALISLFMQIDYFTYGSWFYKRMNTFVGALFYLTVLVFFVMLLLVIVQIDRERVSRIEKLEELKQMDIVTNTIRQISKNLSFNEKIRIALKTIEKYLDIKKSIIYMVENNKLKSIYKRGISAKEEKEIKNAIHRKNSIGYNIRLYKLHGTNYYYAALKTRKPFSESQKKFILRCERNFFKILESDKLFDSTLESREKKEAIIEKYKHFHDLTSELQNAWTIEELYWKLVAAIPGYFRVQSASIIDVSHPQKEWSFLALHNIPNHVAKVVEKKIKNPGFSGNLMEVKDNKKVLYIKDTRKYKEGWVNVEGIPLSCIGVPIFVDGEVAAIINIDGYHQDGFTEEDIVFANALSDVVSGIVQKMVSLEKMKLLSIKDPLTSIYNRREFDIRFKEEMERVRRHRRPLSVVITDIDRFKKCNDTFGHLEGDRLLIESSKIISSSIRLSDVLFRFGGDEFVLLFPETASAQAAKVLKKIMINLKKLVRPDGHHVTMSLGIAQYRDGDTFETLLGRADKGMYKAKGSGGNCICGIED